jgi:hypothetical protein
MLRKIAVALIATTIAAAPAFAADSAKTAPATTKSDTTTVAPAAGKGDSATKADATKSDTKAVKTIKPAGDVKSLKTVTNHRHHRHHVMARHGKPSGDVAKVSKPVEPAKTSKKPGTDEVKTNKAPVNAPATRS